MGVDEVVQRLRVELAHDPIDVVRDPTIAADLPRQATLKPNPLSVDVGVALKLRAITLDAGVRTDVDGYQHAGSPQKGRCFRPYRI